MSEDKMNGGDEQTEILREIWNQLKALDRSFNTQLGALRVEVTTELRGLRSDVDGLKTEMIGLRGDVDRLKIEMIEVKAELREVKAELKGLRTDVDDLESETKAIRVATQAGFALLARAEERNERDLRARIERIEAHVGLGPP